jgi:hypothetical protein
VAESGRNCKECGQPLKVFSGLTIDGDSYHDLCWENRRGATPKTPPRVSSEVTPS